MTEPPLAPTGLTQGERRLLEERINPEGWTTEQWISFYALFYSNGAYNTEVKRLRDYRHEWAEAATRKSLDGKRVTPGVAHSVRLEMNAESRRRFPNPCPLEWGKA